MAQWSVRPALETGTKDLSESDKVVLERYGAFCRSTMPGSSPEQQFDAAVQLIRGLPKDGPFQPSNDMKLRLYGYFKQVTEGPCTQPAPSFWDVIGKAKWGAWKNLGDMPAEEAMTSYVGEIKKVMETMSLTDDMANLMDTLGPVYEYVENENGSRPARKKHVHFSADEEAPATNGHSGPEEVAESAPEETSSPSTAEQNGVLPPPAAEETNGGHQQPERWTGSVEETNGGHQQPERWTGSVEETNGGHQQPERWTGSATSDTDDDEEFNDPIGEAEAVSGRGDATEARLDALHHQLLTLTRLVDSAGSQMQRTEGGLLVTNGTSSVAAPLPVGPRGGRTSASAGLASCPGVHDELRALVRDMRDDLDTVTGRLRSLEAATSSAHHSGKREVRPWWQVPELSPRTLLLLLAWPLVLQLVLRLISARRRRK